MQVIRPSMLGYLGLFCFDFDGFLVNMFFLLFIRAVVMFSVELVVCVLFTLSEVVLNLVLLWRPASLCSNICQSGARPPPPTPPLPLAQRLHPSSDDQIMSRFDTHLRRMERWGNDACRHVWAWLQLYFAVQGEQMGSELLRSETQFSFHHKWH